jgi:hypothetical protein
MLRAKRSPFSMQSYVERNFDSRRSGDFETIKCVFCGKQWKLYVNVVDEKPWGWCFSCETWTDAVKLVMTHRGVDRFRAKEIMNGGEYSRGGSARPVAKAPEPGAPVLPPEYEPLSPLGHGGLSGTMYEYARRRMTSAQVVQHGIGFCASGPYCGRLIVPATKDGVIAYFVARAVRCSPGAPRYLNPSRGSLGVGKSQILFGLDQARADGLDDIVLTEGVFDALALGPRGVAILGKQLSDEQLIMLRSVKRVGVMLDADAADEQAKMVQKLYDSGIEAYPLRVLGKDPSVAGGAAEVGERSFVDHVRALTRLKR